MTAAFDFLCHVEAFLQSLHKFPRQYVAVGKLSTAQGGLLSPLAVQWHIVAAEKLATAQGGPLSPLAVQWHVVAAEKLSTAQGACTPLLAASSGTMRPAAFLLKSVH